MLFPRLVREYKGLKLFQCQALSDNYIYLLHDQVSQETVVIDPSEAAPVIDLLEREKFSVTAIWNTHHHGDHIGGNQKLKAIYGCTVYCSAYDKDRISTADYGLSEGDPLKIGKWQVQVLTAPGHTLGHCLFYLPEAGLLFCGDTLFGLGCGRLFEGSPEQMWSSLEKIRQLPAETLVLCAHEYTLSNAQFALSLPVYAKDLELYVEQLKLMRARGEATVPSQLGTEQSFNPFLQSTVPQLAEAYGLVARPPHELFAALRAAKDQFQG